MIETAGVVHVSSDQAIHQRTGDKSGHQNPLLCRVKPLCSTPAKETMGESSWQLAAIIHCHMHVSIEWQIVNSANTVQCCYADAVLSKHASKSQTDTNCKKHMVGSICQQSEQAGATMQSQDDNPVTESMLAAPDVLGQQHSLC